MKDTYSERGVWWAVGWRTVAVIAVLGLLGAAIWAVGVGTSDLFGRGEQRKQINRAENRTFQQEHFETLYADIQGYDQQIDVQAIALAGHPAQDAERDRLAAVVSGLRNQCISTRQQYNADARKVSAERFRAADLPPSIDEQDPAFDCKESSQ